jgi:CBS domain-containing protein
MQALSTEHERRPLSVLVDEGLAGIISIGDCAKQVSRPARSRAEEVKKHSSGTDPTRP